MNAAHVVLWLDHSDAMCSRAWRALCSCWFEVRFKPRPG